MCTVPNVSQFLTLPPELPSPYLCWDGSTAWAVKNENGKTWMEYPPPPPLSLPFTMAATPPLPIFDIVPCELVQPGRRCGNPKCVMDHSKCAFCYMYTCVVCGAKMCDDCVNTMNCVGYTAMPVCRRVCFAKVFGDLIKKSEKNYAEVIATYASKPAKKEV